MPYLGLLNGEPIKPIETHPDATVTCPSCERDMGLRTSHYKANKFVPTHFFHYQNPNGCGGESAAHFMMKSVAAEKLEEIFPHADVELEVGIGERIADVRAKVDQPMKPHGKGLVVEAQHKNKGKNIGRVGREYFKHDHSVYWAYLSDFENEYLRDFALDILSPVQVCSPGWTEHETIWMHENDPLAWFNLLEAPNGRRYLEARKKDRESGWQTHSAVPITRTARNASPSLFAKSSTSTKASESRPVRGGL